MPRAHQFEVFVEASTEAAQAARLGRLGDLAPDDLDWLARQLAGLAFDFTIRAPGELRAAVREQAEWLAAIAGG